MYNLNVSISGPPLLSVEGGIGSATPRTPEILNSLIAMTSPLEYSFPSNQHRISQYESHSSCSGSPLDSPANNNNATPSVQQTCSQLIKAGLKLSLEMKRKMSSGGDSSGTENSHKIAKREYIDSSDDEETDSKSTRCGLTPEDEDRRRRRRERNKIAATKCRMKKRERTLNLVSESEILENQNIDLKTQVRSLEMERRTLTEMLQSHSTTCIRPEGFQPPPTRCTIPISKYINDIANYSVDGLQSQHQPQQQQQHQPQLRPIQSMSSANKQPIPSMNTIKFCSNLKHQQQQEIEPALINCDTLSSTLADMNFCGKTGTMISTGYCKPSPTGDSYAMSPDSGFIKSPVPDILNGYSNNLHHGQHHIKNDYIPNCENSNGAESNFQLKCELTDGHESPYTTVQSADRFLFDGTETFDSGIGGGGGGGGGVIGECNNGNSCGIVIGNNGCGIDNTHRHHSSMKILNNNNNININNNTTIIEFTSAHCQNFETNLLKTDFLSQTSEFLTLGDGTETQFTDLDSGVTTYTNVMTTNNNSGCMA